jgi:hypothetical protein
MVCLHTHVAVDNGNSAYLVFLTDFSGEHLSQIVIIGLIMVKAVGIIIANWFAVTVTTDGFRKKMTKQKRDIYEFYGL